MDRPLRHLPPLSPPPLIPKFCTWDTKEREHLHKEDYVTGKYKQNSQQLHTLLAANKKENSDKKNLCSESLIHQQSTKYLAVMSYVHIALRVGSRKLNSSLRFDSAVYVKLIANRSVQTTMILRCMIILPFIYCRK